MKLKFLAATIIMMAIGICSTEAQTRPGNRTQKQRIKQGVKSGELTKGETARLMRMKKDTRRDIKMAKTDGVITRRERKEIRRDKKRSSRAIYRSKHNNRKKI